jgi:uncharacterized protein YbcV (DUF1398 family)
MDSQRLIEIRKQARAERWSFVKHMDVLREAGVVLIRMKLVTGETEFLDGTGASVVLSPPSLLNRTVAFDFQPDAIEQTRYRYGTGRISLEEHYSDLTSAGVRMYEQDLADLSTCYYGWSEHLPDRSLITTED